jgi:peptide/nickel transport system substrate-binding protein
VTGGGPRRRRFLALAAGAVAAAGAPRWVGATERPLRGGVLKQIGLEPPTFDVHATASHQTQLISSFVRRTLFKLVHGARSGPSDFTLAPDLALKAVASSERRIYTITLRPGARWESRPPVNGREVVAADVKFSLERVLRASPFAPLLGPVERIDAPDRRTVRVHLAESFTPFVHSLAEPWTAIVPPEAADRSGDPKAAESLIGCGPFVLERYEPGVKAVFSRNPTYHARGLPYLDKVEWLFIKDRPTRIALFRAGQVDLPSHDARVPRAEAVALRKENAGYPIVRWDGLEVRSLAMRTDRPPFNDVRVRRALSLAVDRKTWMAEHLDGEGAEGHGPVPSAMRPWKLAARQLGDGARYLGHDPALARTLLTEAGFPAGLKIKCTSCPGYGPEYVEDLERLAGHLRRVGVELQILNEEHAPYIRGSFLGRFEEASWGPSSLFTDVDAYLSSFFRSGQAGNRSHVVDAQLDGMLGAQRRASSSAARKEVIDEIQRRAAAQVYYVFTPVPRNLSSWTPRLRNYGPKNSFDRGAQLEVVWLDPA